MKKIIILVAALLVLGGGGAGAYFYFFAKPAEASAGAEVGDNHEQAKEEEHQAEGGGGHGAAKKAFVELDPLVLPIVDNEGVTQVVSVVVALEVADDKVAAEVKYMKPKLTDAYIQDMYGMLNQHAALRGGVIQVSTIKTRLSKITTEILGEHVVDEVLLQVVQQRPI